MGLSQSQRTLRFGKWIKYLSSRKSLIKFLRRYSSFSFEQCWNTLSCVMLLSDREQISMLGTSASAEISSSLLPQRFKFLIEESLSFLHFYRMKSGVKTFAIAIKISNF